MALQVWLPFNGDLHNQGLSNFIITSNGAVENNSGKLGKCMKINNATNLFYTPNFNTTGLSFGGWFKFNKNEIATILQAKTYSSTATTATGNLLGNTSYGGIGLIWTSNNMYSSSNVFSSLQVFSTLRTATVNDVTSSYLITFDTWVHLFLTWNPSTHILNFYVNGILHNSKTFSTFSDGVSRALILNYHAIYGGNGPTANIPFYTNDIRIYNHCLSEKEVEEISKGLVLHYQLNNGNPNLLSEYVTPGQGAPGATNTGGRTNYYGKYGIIIPATENADTYFRLFLKQQLVQGTTYTISCYVSGLLPGSYYNFPLFAQGNTSMGVLQLNHNGLCSLTFTMNNSSQSAVTTPEGDTVYVCFMDDAGRTLASGQGAITVNGFKLEQGNSVTNFSSIDNDIIYDTSGYNNNGEIINNIGINSNSPKYYITSLFNNATIALSPIFYDNINQCHTVAAWVYPTSTNDTVLINFNAGYKLYHGNGGRSLMYLNSGTYDSYVYGSVIPINVWTHVVWVLDTATQLCKVYYNGVLNATSNNYTSSDIPSGVNKNLIIGSGYFGNLSDFRIYATALTPAQIKELYETSKIVDGTTVKARDLEVSA